MISSYLIHHLLKNLQFPPELLKADWLMLTRVVILGKSGNPTLEQATTCKIIKLFTAIARKNLCNSNSISLISIITYFPLKNNKALTSQRRHRWSESALVHLLLFILSHLNWFDKMALNLVSFTHFNLKLSIILVLYLAYWTFRLLRVDCSRRKTWYTTGSSLLS